MTNLFKERQARVVHDGRAIGMLRLVLAQVAEECGCGK
jgi:hypothetical protein